MQPLGTGLRMLATAIFGEKPRPGAMHAIRRASRYDTRVFNLLNRGIYLETLERRLMAQKARVRELFEEVYATASESAYQKALEAEAELDRLLEEFEAKLGAYQRELNDGVYVLFVDATTGELVREE